MKKFAAGVILCALVLDSQTVRAAVRVATEIIEQNAKKSK